MASVAALANTGTVTATLKDGTFNVAFDNHAHETNSLWVVYGTYDYGFGTNGWDHVERLGTITPETNSWTYAAPAGWGTKVSTIRFILSEVPYDYDYSTTYTAADQVPAGSTSIAQCICIDNDENFTMDGSYRIYAKFALGKIPTGHNQTIFCARNAASETPYFALFWIKGSSPKFRFDYNDSAKSSSKAYKDADAIIEAEASSSGGLVLKANGTTLETIARPGAAFTGQTSGPLLLFTSKADAASNPACMRLYAFRVYSSGGDVLLDLVPMVKDGKAGMYDIVHGKAYTASLATSAFREMDAGARIESVNPFFADALCTSAVTGPTVFSPASAITLSDSITNAYGGIMNGTGTLTLTGANDWGGAFTVSNGTLLAAFGQGLGTNDNLRLESNQATNGAYGGYGGWNGQATASLGTGAGQISVTAGGYLAYCAANGGELDVDIGGAGAAWTPTADYSNLLLNGAAGAGTLNFSNPIALTAADLFLRVGFGTVVFEESIASGSLGTDGKSLDVHTLDNPGVACDGVGVLKGKDNRFFNLTVSSGSIVFDEGTTNTIGGTLLLKAGAASSVLATNAVVNLTGEDGAGGWLEFLGGLAEFQGGELTAGGIHVGEDKDQASDEAKRPGLVLNGKMTLSAIGSNSYGSCNILRSARSAAITIEDGADISLRNFVHRSRNVYHNGGRLDLWGGQGVCYMGASSTSRYWLRTGAELIATCISANATNSAAQFLIQGGKLKTSSIAATPFFQNFEDNPTAFIWVASKFGGEFCVEKNTTVPKGVSEVASNILSGSSAWNYAAADWLTAPAFKKTGSKTLTMKGTNTYNCATDVAAGTLVLAGGDKPGALPTNGVVRVTGGTLDLGGNEQTVRALVGTAGAIANGTLVAKEGIYPGGAGAVGSFTCGAALDGELHIDVDASTHTADKIVADGTLDISGIDLVLPEPIPDTVQKVKLVDGETTGVFRSVSGLPSGWEIMSKANGLWAQKVVGTTIIFR